MERCHPRVWTVVSTMFGQNSYVVAGDDDPRCVVLDPGLEPGKIVRLITGNGLTPEAILITHGHADHIAGIEALTRRWPEIEIVIGEADAPKLTDPNLNLSADFGFPLVAPPATRTVREGDRLVYGLLTFQVLEIPGHSEGHVVYLVEGASPPLAFVGDVIFARSVGRTDLPNGSFQLLAEGIRAKIYSLSDNTELFSGHGEPTTVGAERKLNPYVRG